MQLRPYQTEALEAVREAYRRGHRAVLVVMPTGTGKTVLFAEISRLAKGPVLVLAHRQELVEQARDKISAWIDDVVAVEMGSRRELTRPDGTRPKITVASVQTLGRRLASIPRDAFRIVVVDEAHHATADSYRTILDHFHGHLLGVTATPDRSDKAPLGDVFSEVGFEYDMRQAIADGWLCPIRSFLVQTQADFSGVRKVAGELATRGVEEILTRDLHLAEIAEPIVSERGERPTIVFAASVAHARALARVLCELGGDPSFAVALDGTMSLEQRAPVIERFRAGRIKVLVNCSLFTEGFDVPDIALVAIARPILSRSFYAQMVGRGTRIAPGKRDLIVLDFLPGNCRHSLVQAVDIFASEREEVQERARAIAAAASALGEAIALEQALELAQQEQEVQDADVAYQLRRRDPFAAIGIDLSRYTRRPQSGQRATADQLKAFKRAGLPTDAVAELSSSQAEALREELLDRKAVGLCTPRQAAKLVAHGIDPREMYHDEAAALLREINA
ncbi:DEAD/DEAH box helicase [Engelhardtia mirabilis]|uniref:Type I restriction enzyme EcoKI subunit R n=1 Tax=Engelhardtia mirabilis TaxID=2528011 RepID=A0A518BMG2_9BACT|nr:type I restriction enzyme EcoKI subunit R [Planctomycetes bacterium Pla133]QDV02496.1 type I restriction enzyme EcoKI subunit R [Planctomycetes bacterium Pla86]